MTMIIFSFYIIMRGVVSVYLRDDAQDALEFDKSITLHEHDRQKLGVMICNMSKLYTPIFAHVLFQNLF